MIKKILITSIIFITSIFICTASFAASQPPKFTSNKKPIIVSRKDAEFVITLPSNLTTGFSWNAKAFNPQFLGIVFHKYIAPRHQKLVGAPGYEAWCFRVKKAAPEKVGLVMEYARPWTTDGATQKTFIIQVRN